MAVQAIRIGQMGDYIIKNFCHFENWLFVNLIPKNFRKCYLVQINSTNFKISNNRMTYMYFKIFD